MPASFVTSLKRCWPIDAFEIKPQNAIVAKRNFVEIVFMFIKKYSKFLCSRRQRFIQFPLRRTLVRLNTSQQSTKVRKTERMLNNKIIFSVFSDLLTSGLIVHVCDATGDAMKYLCRVPKCISVYVFIFSSAIG